MNNATKGQLDFLVRHCTDTLRLPSAEVLFIVEIETGYQVRIDLSMDTLCALQRTPGMDKEFDERQILACAFLVEDSKVTRKFSSEFVIEMTEHQVIALGTQLRRDSHESKSVIPSSS